MIDYLTHFYHCDQEPFLSLSALPDEQALPIMQGLYIEGSVLWERFQEAADYLAERRQTERWLYDAFVAKGGRPQQTYPIYMVLGTPKWTQEMVDAATLATSREIRVPLAIFDESDISFTYPDSMVSFFMQTSRYSQYYQAEYHGQVFTLPEIRRIIDLNGLPGEDWQTHLPDDLPNYIEAQVWNRQPLKEFTNGRPP